MGGDLNLIREPMGKLFGHIFHSEWLFYEYIWTILNGVNGGRSEFDKGTSGKVVWAYFPL